MFVIQINIIILQLEILINIKSNKIKENTI